MLLNKKALELWRLASKDGTRFAISGVHIESGSKATATNGWALMQFEPAYQADTADYPHVEGMKIHYTKDEEPATLEPFTLPAENCREVLKTLPKKSRFPIVGNHIALDQEKTNANGRVIMAVNSIGDIRRFECEKIDGQYPDYTKVIPQEQPTAYASFGVDRLQEMLDTMRACGVEKIKIGIYDENRPCKIKGENKEGDRLLAVIMPMRDK